MKYYTRKELAEILHVKADTISRWISAGYFGEVLVCGRFRLVPQSGLEKYIDSHTGLLAAKKQRVPRARSKRVPVSKL